MLEINLKQLEAFVATAEYRSFTKAAEAHAILERCENVGKVVLHVCDA